MAPSDSLPVLHLPRRTRGTLRHRLATTAPASLKNPAAATRSGRIPLHPNPLSPTPRLTNLVGRVDYSPDSPAPSKLRLEAQPLRVASLERTQHAMTNAQPSSRRAPVR